MGGMAAGRATAAADGVGMRQEKTVFLYLTVIS